MASQPERVQDYIQAMKECQAALARCADRDTEARMYALTLEAIRISGTRILRAPAAHAALLNGKLGEKMQKPSLPRPDIPFCIKLMVGHAIYIISCAGTCMVVYALLSSS